MVNKVKINNVKIKCLDLENVKSTLIVADNFNNKKVQVVIKNKLISKNANEKPIATFIYKKLQQEYNTMLKFSKI